MNYTVIVLSRLFMWPALVSIIVVESTSSDFSSMRMFEHRVGKHEAGLPTTGTPSNTRLVINDHVGIINQARKATCVLVTGLHHDVTSSGPMRG